MIYQTSILFNVKLEYRSQPSKHTFNFETFFFKYCRSTWNLGKSTWNLGKLLRFRYLYLMQTGKAHKHGYQIFCSTHNVIFGIESADLKWKL